MSEFGGEILGDEFWTKALLLYARYPWREIAAILSAMSFLYLFLQVMAGSMQQARIRRTGKLVKHQVGMWQALQWPIPSSGKWKGALSSTRGSVVVGSFLYMLDQVCTLVNVMYCMEEVLGMVRYFSSVR